MKLTGSLLLGLILCLVLPQLEAKSEGKCVCICLPSFCSGPTRCVGQCLRVRVCLVGLSSFCMPHLQTLILGPGAPSGVLGFCSLTCFPQHLWLHHLRIPRESWLWSTSGHLRTDDHRDHLRTLQTKVRRQDHARYANLTYGSLDMSSFPRNSLILATICTRSRTGIQMYDIDASIFFEHFHNRQSSQHC